MKKIVYLLVVMMIFMTFLSACTSNGDEISNVDSTEDTDDKISIVATTFPQYDWIRQILGDELENVDLTLLLDSGVDLHSYQPTVEDIAKISNSHMFVYVGGESDNWTDEVLGTVSNDDMVVINLTEVLGDRVKEEEIVEGMEHSHEHDEEDHDHDHEDDHEHEEHDHEHDDEHEHDEHDHDHNHNDEHVWLSLENAQIISSYISDELTNLLPEASESIELNTEEYISELTALDEEYEDSISSAAYNTLLFGDRFPFRYLVDDYGLDYYAAFSGCSAETEASFETIVFLSNKLDELNIPNIMVIESSDQSIANTIVENSQSENQNILVLDSMQSVTASDVDSGYTYLDTMEKNLEVLKSALN